MNEREQKKSPYDVVEAMALHVIESYVRQKPYLCLVTKRQIWFGNGLFRKSDDIDVKNGLRKFLKVRIPKKEDIESTNAYYGYSALQGPWNFLNNITNHAIRQRIEWKTIDDGDLSDIRLMTGIGYIRKDGTLDPEQTKGKSCYVFFLCDPNYRKYQNDYIKKRVISGEEWFGYQILRAQVTHPHILAEKKKAATTTMTNNRKLLLQKEYLELDPAIDRDKVEWEDFK